jgi:hypothetical protein
MFVHSGNPIVELLPEGDRWRLAFPWWFVWARGGQRVEHLLPTHFETDFASIPRLYRWRFSPTGKAAPAALAHDFMYRAAEHPRSVCDQVFLDGMESCGVGWWDRHVMHKAVRLGGWAAYGKERQAAV